MTGRTLFGAIVVRFAVMLVPAGLAVDRPDDQADPIGVGGVAQATVVGPDERAERVTPGTTEPATILPDDRADRLTPGSTTQPVAETPTAGGGIAWNDPLVVGAFAVLVAGLATAVGVAVVHHHGGRPSTRGTPGTPTPSH
jgi:hypothetical protein